MKYRYAERLVDCAFELPELPPAGAADRRGSLKITLSPDTPVPAPSFTWTDAAGATIAGHASADDIDYLVFPGIAAFAIAGDQITVIPAANVDASVRHCLLDQVLPRLLSREGLVLHGAAVAPDCRSAIVLLGSSGAGKSTLTAYAGTEGAAALADDCVLISNCSDGLYVTGSYPGTRLYADARAEFGIVESSTAPFAAHSEKRRLAMPQIEGTRRIASIVILEPGADAIDIRPVSGAEATMALTSQLFVMNPDNTAAMQKHFMRLGEALRADVPIWHCEFPHAFEQLPSLWSRIMKSIQP